jgi:hypothetical protein
MVGITGGVSGEHGRFYLWRIFHAMPEFYRPTREMRVDLQSAVVA